MSFWWYAGVRSSYVLSAIAFLGVAAFAIVFGPAALLQAEGIGSLSEVERAQALSINRQAILIALGGTIAAAGVLLTFARHQLERRTQDREGDKAHTHRYTEAVAQLGDDSIAIRIGGIYALERLAEDSPRDMPTILRVLAAFVRLNSDRMSTSEEAAGPPEDVRIAFESVCAVARRYRGEAPMPSLSFAGANLRNVEMRNTALPKGTSFRGARMEGMNIRLSQMNGMNLSNALMRESTTSTSNFIDCDLNGADLRRAHFERVRIDSSRFEDAQFDDAELGAVKFDANCEWNDPFRLPGFTPELLSGARLVQVEFDEH